MLKEKRHILSKRHQRLYSLMCGNEKEQWDSSETDKTATGWGSIALWKWAVQQPWTQRMTNDHQTLSSLPQGQTFLQRKRTGVTKLLLWNLYVPLQQIAHTQIHLRQAIVGAWYDTEIMNNIFCEYSLKSMQHILTAVEDLGSDTLDSTL